MTPEIKYALNGDVSIAYHILGNGPVDIIYVPPFVSNLELQWQEPQQARYLQRLASFSRLVMFDKRGAGLSDRRGIATLRRRWGQGITTSFMAPERATDATFLERQGRWERLSASPGAAVALYQMICEIDVRHLLPAVRVPTLILHREGDPTHASRSRFLGRHIPGARMVELPGNEFLPFFGDQDAILGEIE